MYQETFKIICIQQIKIFNSGKKICKIFGVPNDEGNMLFCTRIFNEYGRFEGKCYE